MEVSNRVDGLDSVDLDMTGSGLYQYHRLSRNTYTEGDEGREERGLREEGGLDVLNCV